MSASNIRIDRAELHLTSRMWTKLPEGEIRVAMKKVTWLDSYATAFRYPTETGRIRPSPSEEKLEQVDQDIQKILNLLLNHFDYKLDDPGQKSVRNIKALTFPT